MPSALNAGRSNPNKNTKTGDTHWWEKTNSKEEFTKGKQINSMQKIIKNRIIVGLGFIRCLRNIVFSKNS